jgi:hypothetical protein
MESSFKGITSSGDPEVDSTMALSLAHGELSGPITAGLCGESLGSIVALRFPGACANATTKLLIRDSKGTRRLVLLVSSHLGPDIVARGIEAAARARGLLGNELGAVILPPLTSGRVGGLSYALFPYCRPLSDLRLLGRIQDWRFRSPVLDWLRAATAKTMKYIPDDDLASKIATPLHRLTSLEALGEEIRRESRNALQRLDSGAWRPRSVLMHGDLTRGNVLRSPLRVLSSEPGIPVPIFVLIDWPGSQPDGSPFLDLVSCGRWMHLGDRRLKREVAIHRDLLGCTREEVRYSLLAALGDLGLRLDRFPFDRYVILARSCYEYLESALSLE